MKRNYLVTKCYDSSNNLLVNKDLLLFFHYNKLRIVNDFTSTINDFGCYELEIDSFDLYYGKRIDIVTIKIKTDKFYLSLGKRAKSFISKTKKYSKKNKLQRSI